MSKSTHPLIAPKVKRRREMGKEITKLKNMLTFEEQEQVIVYMKRIVSSR